MKTGVADLDAQLTSSNFFVDPYPTYARLRAEAPVFWSEAWGGWVFTRYANVGAILRYSAFPTCVWTSSAPWRGATTSPSVGSSHCRCSSELTGEDAEIEHRFHRLSQIFEDWVHGSQSFQDSKDLKHRFAECPGFKFFFSALLRVLCG